MLTQLSILRRQVSPGRLVPELRPVASYRAGPWFVVGSLGLSTVSGPSGRASLSPQGRINYTLPGGLELGFEHYAELGRVPQHQSFLTLGAPVGPVEVNLGLGRGLTAGSEPWVARLRVEVEF